MSVNNVSGNYSNYSTYLTNKNKTVEEQKKADKKTDAAEAAATGENASVDGDTVELSTKFQVDMDKVEAMKSSLWHKVDAFEKMVNALFQKQGITYNDALGMKKNLENLIAGGGVSEADRLAAQEAISENGEWGVNKTAERIMNFAKAVSGGDPAKINELREAVKAGFKEAEKVWGGSLPDICQKTYDKIMSDFDEWEKSANAGAAAQE